MVRSFSNSVSERQHLSGRNMFLAILNNCSIGADLAGGIDNDCILAQVGKASSFSFQNANRDQYLYSDSVLIDSHELVT